MRVLVLLPREPDACAFFRLFAPARALQEQGADVERRRAAAETGTLDPVTTPPRPPYEYLAELLRGAQPENAVIFILGYGLGRFESEIPVVAAATGMTEEDLHELAEEARLGSDPSAPRRSGQHLVSQALLREFCTMTPNGPRMGHYSTEYGARPDVSPHSVAKLDGFVEIDSERTEEVWGRVETTLPDAIKTAQAGSLFSHAEHVATIKDAIALHYARSFDVKEHYDALWKTFLATKAAELRSNPELIDQLHRLKTGATATPTAAEREAIIEDFLAGVANLANSGVLFRYRVVYYFNVASALVANAGLELLRAPTGSEFLIGDVPVITADRSGHRRGIEAGVPIGSASLVAMPLSPTLLVSLSKTDSDQVLSVELVERLNTWQIEAAKRSVFTRQGSPLVAWVATVRPNRVPGSRSRP